MLIWLYYLESLWNCYFLDGKFDIIFYIALGSLHIH